MISLDETATGKLKEFGAITDIIFLLVIMTRNLDYLIGQRFNTLGNYVNITYTTNRS